MAKRWQDMTSRQQAVALTLMSVQLSLAASAWADLATRPKEVMDCLYAVETAVETRGLYAAGFIAYEAAPGFDPSSATAMATADRRTFPDSACASQPIRRVTSRGKPAPATVGSARCWSSNSPAVHRANCNSTGR